MNEDQVVTTSKVEKNPPKWLTILAIVAIIVIGGYFLLFKGKSTTAPVQQRENSEAPQGGVPENRVIVEDYSAGKTVNVSVIKLSSPGFAVVHEDDEGKPGDVIGVSDLLSEGEHNDVAISLDRVVESGESIHIVLHADNGDGEFNSANDKAVLNDEGGMVSESYLVGAGE